MTPDTIEKLKFLQSNRPFLGREFLTWLWYRLECQSHSCEQPGAPALQIYLDDKIVLSSASGPVREHALKGGTPAAAEEARRALLAGKLVTEANFIMKQGERIWSWSLKADDLSPRNIRLPGVTADEAEAYLHSRLEAIEMLTATLDRLYAEFLEQRFSRKFSVTSDEMTQWAERDQSPSTRSAPDRLQHNTLPN